MDAGDVEIMRLLEVTESFLMPKLFLWIRKQGHPLKTMGESGLDSGLKKVVMI